MNRILILVLLTAFYRQGIPQTITAPSPDAIYVNGKVVTVDPDDRVVEAFSVLNGKFLATGTTSEVSSLAGPDTHRIDLQGRTVLPGLMDNHNHQYHVALLTLRGVDIRGIGSLGEMFGRLEDAVTVATPGETIYTTMGWQADDLVENRGPDLAELNQIAPDNPVVVYATRSRLHINTAAMHDLGIGPNTPNPPRVIIHRDSDGNATGLVTGQPAAVMIYAARIVPQPSPDEKKQLIKTMQVRQNAMGLTGIRDLQLYPDVMRAYFDLWRDGDLTLRVSIGLELNAGEEDRIDAMLAPWGVASGYGDEWLRIDGVAEYNPGDWFREPYSNSDGTDAGRLRLAPADFIAAIRKINSYGWRPSIHVAGDRALDLVLDAYEAANRDRSITDRRWIVEHIQLVHDDQIERIKNLGVMVSAQFQPYGRAGRSLVQWGRDRLYGAMRIKDLLDNGIIVSGGSDWPGAPNNPFLNIYYYVTRDTLDLGPVGIDQKISRLQAVRVMSLNNAYLMYNERFTGSIEPGKLADFIVLTDDILTVPESEIPNIRPLATYVGGTRVFAAPNAGF